MSTATRFHLLEQQRSSDVQHTQILNKCSNAEQIAMEDIEIYPHLTQTDIQQHPEEWKYAPILVATNHERINITQHKSALFAKDHKTHVFKWKVDIKSIENPPITSLMEQVEEENAFFWQYFVPGAPINMTDRLNTDLALVNGTPATLHSIETTTEQHEQIQQQIQSLPYGSEIIIQQPLYVNIKLDQSLDGKKISRRRQQQLDILQTYSIDNTGKDIIIPIAPKQSKTLEKPKWYTFVNGNPMQLYGKALIRDPFPYMIAFAITIHKAQGRTLKKVILDLTCHPDPKRRLTFPAIYVALSRVKTKFDLRLLHHPNMSSQSAYEYITNLKQNQDVIAFYKGFKGDTITGQNWDPTSALNM
jgi:hypothetical protein